MSSDIAIVFGAGARVGNAVARKLLSNNYKVVTVSRKDFKIDEFPGTHFHFQGDLKNLDLVPAVFAKTRELFGEPRVIVYNAAANTKLTKTVDEFLSVTGEEFNTDQNINVSSVFLSVQESIKSFDKITSTDKPKAFIFTGNMQNLVPMPLLTTLGIGKSATFATLSIADKLVGSKGYRFYYADERTAQGTPAFQNLSAEAAAEFYFDLAENSNEDIPVEATYVLGKGYVKF